MTEERPPLERTDTEMKAIFPRMTTKMQMALVGEACYVRHGKGWVLLDAENHGYTQEELR